jgi:hypothetical protein
MTNTDQTSLPTAKESADEHAGVLYTHMQHAVKITWKQQLPNKTILIDHCRIHMREYNPVCKN